MGSGITPIFLALNGRRGGKARLEERRAGYNDGLADTANETWKGGMEEMKELDAAFCALI